MRKAGEIISALFKERFGQEFMETALSSAELFSSWSRIITGLWPRVADLRSTDLRSADRRSADPCFEDIPAVAVHSRIRELERGVLLVEADHPGWIQILQTKQEQILSAVQCRHPELNIRSIAFRLSREPFTKPVKEPATEIKTWEPHDVAHVAPIYAVHTPVRNLPGDKEFLAALKGLEESVKKRNRK